MRHEVLVKALAYGGYGVVKDKTLAKQFVISLLSLPGKGRRINNE